MLNRDWHSYNESLVRRGELDLDSSVLEEWRKRELKKANDGKVGEEPCQPLPGVVHQAPRLCQASLPPALQADGGFRTLPLQVREVEGLQAPDYSTIDRRVNKQAPDQPR